MMRHGDTEGTEMSMEKNAENAKVPRFNLISSVPFSVPSLRDLRASVARFPLN
ncbi:MAG: hypothetical protein H6P99_2515 [Holophagaceae bacterium]|nr:hypothetical protein [Holophagaceae bacterium]